MSDPGPYVQPSQVRRRTLVFLLPYLEQACTAVEASSGETSEVQIEIANLRNLAYCQSLKGQTETKVFVDELAELPLGDWLKI